MGRDLGACPAHQKTFQPHWSRESVYSVTPVAPTLGRHKRRQKFFFFFFLPFWTVGCCSVCHKGRAHLSVWQCVWGSLRLSRCFSSCGWCCLSLLLPALFTAGTIIRTTRTVAASVCCHVAVSAIVVPSDTATNSTFLVWVGRNMATTLLGVSVFVVCTLVFVVSVSHQCGVHAPSVRSRTSVYIYLDLCVLHIILTSTDDPRVCFCLSAIVVSSALINSPPLRETWPFGQRFNGTKWKVSSRFLTESYLYRSRYWYYYVADWSCRSRLLSENIDPHVWETGNLSLRWFVVPMLRDRV